MKAIINKKGVLNLVCDSALEFYAAEKWHKDNCDRYHNFYTQAQIMIANNTTQNESNNQ